jgi:uncharacterized metal-binding protein YceD (DUF177 family)
MDDPGVILYEADHVDLEEPIQEAIILNINPFWHPPRDNQDRCTVCSRDCSSKVWTGEQKREKSSAFGSLLKDALNTSKKG